MVSNSRNDFMLHRLPWILSGLLVLALAGTLGSRGTDPAASSNDQTLARIMARLDAIEAQQAAPAPAASGASATNSATMASPSMAARLQQRMKSPEQQMADRKQEMLQLEAEFSRDAKDPRGAQMQSALEKVVTSKDLTSSGIKPESSRIDCRARLCRISADFAKAGDAQDWAVFYVTVAGPNFTQSRVVYVPQPGGGSEVRIYAARAR
jgi:hypothetical protein